MKRALAAVFLLMMGLVIVVRSTGQTPRPSQTPPAHPNWRTFQSKAYGLSLRYPDAFAVADLGAGQDLPAEALSYIPACDRDSGLCVYYAGDEFENSNFESAGVGVTVYTSGDAQATCERQDDNLPVEGERSSLQIGGLRFTKVRSGDAGMGHVAEEYRYWTLSGGRCLVIEARIGYSHFELYEPGRIEEFTEEERKALRDTLEEIVATLEFAR